MVAWGPSQNTRIPEIACWQGKLFTASHLFMINALRYFDFCVARKFGWFYYRDQICFSIHKHLPGTFIRHINLFLDAFE